MKHAIVIGTFALFLVAVGCAPDPEPATTTCSSITDCAIGKACDQTTHQCVPEADNRFLGRFHCKVSSAEVTDLQLSEVVGKADGERYALTNTTCTFNPETKNGVIFLADDDGGETIQLTLKEGKSGRVTLGPAISKGDESNDPFAIVYNDTRFTREATSVAGFINLSTAIADGADLEAYLDFTVTIPPKHVDAVIGEPCRNGLADCGSALPSVGGARVCFLNTLNPKAVPVCSRTCTSNGDCALGKAVCTNGLCRRPCTTDAECADITSVCGEPDTSQESRGCVQTGP